MTGSSNADRVAAIYDDLAPTWDARQGLVERVLMGQGMRRALADELRGDVLEIGTGTGPTLRFLHTMTSITSFTGTDLSEGMLDQARKLAAESALPFPVSLNLVNAETLNFPDATFDTVTTSLMLCTVGDPVRALQEMARVCKPGGRIVLLEHVLARNRLLAGLQRKLTPGQVRRLGCHFDRQTDQVVRDLGFEIIREQSRFFGIFRLIVAHPHGERQADHG